MITFSHVLDKLPDIDPPDVILVLEALGIDPDADQHSIHIHQRPLCPRCDGIGRVNAGYCDDGLGDECCPPGGHEGDPCPTCHGTSYVPDEWATVDRCLD